jgi:hypothetical protein
MNLEGSLNSHITPDNGVLKTQLANGELVPNASTKKQTSMIPNSITNLFEGKSAIAKSEIIGMRNPR